MFLYQGKNVANQNGETKTEVTDEIKSRKDSVSGMADIEEAVPNETEGKNIDKQR